MSFDLNILVNGNRCKQYHHQGKTFIEAKHGSEYVIEIKNNYWKRVLAVASVDGLNVLTGKTASDKDTGYIVGAHSAEKIKGFRFSDNEWAMFKFGYKFYGNTYAQSKEDGSEKNCGIIGVRLFYEKEPLYTYYSSTPQWGGLYGTGRFGYNVTNNINYTCNTLGQEKMDMGDTLSSDHSPMSRELSSLGNPRSATISSNCCYSSAIPNEQPKANFDMGTEWGRKEYSKVNNVSFDRGCQAQSFDIYYASRESLIDMGVPITNELSVNLPQSFPNSFAQPPKNWRG